MGLIPDDAYSSKQWRMDQKVAAAAIATLVVWLVQLLAGVDVPVGVEGAVAVVVAYLIPSTARRPLDPTRDECE